MLILVELPPRQGTLMRVYKESKTGRGYMDYFFRGERLRVKAGSSMRAAEQLRLRIESEINAGKHNPAALREEVRGGGKSANTFGGLVKVFLGSDTSRGGTGFYRSRAKIWLAHYRSKQPCYGPVLGTLQPTHCATPLRRVWRREGFPCRS